MALLDERLTINEDRVKWLDARLQQRPNAPDQFVAPVFAPYPASQLAPASGLCGYSQQQQVVANLH